MATPATTTRGLLALLTVLGSIMLALAVPAAADTSSPDPVSKFKNMGTGNCLNIIFPPADPPTIVGPIAVGSVCDSRDTERWRFAGPNMTSTLENVATGLCLNDSGSGSVDLLQCDIVFTPSELWHVAPSGGHVVNHKTGRCPADLPLADASPLRTTIHIVPCDDPSLFKDWIHHP